MNFYSTRNRRSSIPLRNAILQGVAADGGLYMPTAIPSLPRAFFNNIPAMSAGEIAYIITNTFFGNDVDSETIKSIVSRSIDFDIPVVPIGDTGISSLELFHGPTLAINDLGSQFMARLLFHFTPGRKPLNILVATSGDAGSAVAAGFHDMPGVRVFILYPSGKVTDFQEAQFTTMGRNVTAIEVYGDFDDCQKLVQRALMDPEIAQRIPLTSANSINIGRLLPQTMYFFHGYARLIESGVNPDEIVISVPCGNLATLTAGVIAKRMGLPIKRFVATGSRGCFFSRFMATGEMSPVKTGRSIMAGIDVSHPSNIDRIIDLYNGDRQAMAREITPVEIDDARALSTIAEVDSRYGYLFDPHGAATYAALADEIKPGEAGLVVAAAHPVKYRRVVSNAVDRPVDLPGHVSDIFTRPRHRKRLHPVYPDFKEYLLTHSYT